jgi:hypothetical protein
MTLPDILCRKGIACGDRVVTKAQLQPDNVMPSPELESDTPEHPNRNEPQRLMELDAGWIRQRDASVSVHIALPTQEVEQGRVE